MDDDETEEQVEVLGSQNIATDGPFKLEMSIMLIGESGEHEGYIAWAGIDLPAGKIPTDEHVSKRLQMALDNTPAGFRLATREEFVNSLLCERSGGIDMNFSIPGPKDFRLSPMALNDEEEGESQ